MQRTVIGQKSRLWIVSVPFDTIKRTEFCSTKYGCTLFGETVPFLLLFFLNKEHNPLNKNPLYFQPLRFANQDVSWSRRAEIVRALNNKTLTSY